MSDYQPELDLARRFALEATPEIRRIDELLGAGPAPVDTGIVLWFEDARAYYVTQVLESFDREFRRTAASARQRGVLRVEDALTDSVAAYLAGVEEARPDSFARGSRPPTRPRELRQSLHGVRPDSPSQSSLRIVASEPGSSLMLLEALGVAVNIMASTPMSAVANAAAWSGPVRFIRAFFRRSADPLKGVSLRQGLAVISEFGGDPQAVFGPPDEVVELAGPSISLPDGTLIQGDRRISVVRQYADGTTDYIEVQ